MPVDARPTLRLLELGVRWPPETFLRWKLEGLAKRGVEVTVASRAVTDPSARLEGVGLLALPGRGHGAPAAWRVVPRALATAARAPRRTVRLLRAIAHYPPAYRRRYGGWIGLLWQYRPLVRLDPDVVHIEWNHAAALYRPLFDVWRRPVVTSCHGSELSADRHLPGYEAYAELLPDTLRAASAVHCVADSLRREVTALGVPAGRARLIRGGVDPEVFGAGRHEPRREGAPLRVLVVGWPRWVKGFEWALQGLRQLLDAGVPAHLELLGAHPQHDLGEAAECRRLRHTITDLGLEASVVLRGEVTTPGVAEAMGRSDVLLLPSLEEGVPTVVLEAMAAGIPVVAARCGGVEEAVRDGVEGLLVAPRDAAAMAAALGRLSADEPLRARLGRAGRATALARFGLARHVDEFLALYQELCAA